jgi:hypothetical protein
MKTVLAAGIGWLLLSGSTFGQTIHMGPDTPVSSDVMTQAKVPMRDDQIKQVLAARGYSDIKVGDHGKDHVDVTALKNGRPETLTVDPHTGEPN